MQTRVGDFHEFQAYAGKQAVNITTAKSPSFQLLTGESKFIQQNLMETSFEQNVAQDHVLAIWNASIHFLRNSVKIPFDQEKGFNDASIFQCGLEPKDEMANGIQLTYLISKNSILRELEKKHFLFTINSQKDLKDLLERLAKIFEEQIFEEILLIIYEIWQKYLIFKQTTKLSEELSKFLVASSFEIDMEKQATVPIQNYYIHQSQQYISSMAEQAAQQISGCYFLSTKLRYLNLREAETLTGKTNQIRSQFQTFIQIIAKAVYLCADGCFYHPNGQNFTRALSLNSETSSFMQKMIEEEEHNFSQGRKRKNI